MNELLVLQHKNLRAQEEIELQHLKLGSDMEHLQNCYAKLKVKTQDNSTNIIQCLYLAYTVHS